MFPQQTGNRLGAMDSARPGCRVHPMVAGACQPSTHILQNGPQ